MNPNMNVKMQAFRKFERAERGNMLLSLAIAIFLTMLISIWGIPKWQSYVVESAVPPVADEIKRFIARTVATTYGSSTTPYTGLNQAYLARSVRGSALQVDEDGTNVQHSLGGKDTGLVTLEETGAAFTLTFANVSVDACPALANTLQRSVDDITINGSTVKTTDANKNVTQAFTGAANGECTDGDTNTFVFTVR